MRTQTFGVEIEMTGITRQAAAEVAAEYFGTTAVYAGGTYKKYTVSDGTDRQWSFAYDSSIRVERKNGREANEVEMVTPILHYALEFHGRKNGAVATIVPKEDSRVPVVVWEIFEQTSATLIFMRASLSCTTRRTFVSTSVKER